MEDQLAKSSRAARFLGEMHGRPRRVVELQGIGLGFEKFLEGCASRWFCAKPADTRAVVSAEQRNHSPENKLG